MTIHKLLVQTYIQSRRGTYICNAACKFNIFRLLRSKHEFVLTLLLLLYPSASLSCWYSTMGEQVCSSPRSPRTFTHIQHGHHLFLSSESDSAPAFIEPHISYFCLFIFTSVSEQLSLHCHSRCLSGARYAISERASMLANHDMRFLTTPELCA